MNWRSLHFKLALTVTAGALLVVVVSSYILYQRTYEASLQDSERSVRQLMETVQTTAAIAAYVSNKQLAQDVATGLAKNEIVLGVEIRNGTGALAQRGVSGSAADAAFRLPLTAPFSAEEITGELRVQANQPLIAKRAREAALATTVMLAAQAAIVALLVLVGVYWMMTLPLTLLSGRLHRITPGASDRLPTSRRHAGDEIGVLVNDINQLLSTVEHILQDERDLRRQVELLEHRFRGIFEDSSAGIFLLDTAGRLVTANPAFHRLTELASTQQALLSSVDCIPAIFLDAAHAHDLIQLALNSGRPCSGDLRFANHPDGTERWSHCIFSPGQSETGLQTVEGVIYDITERKLAEVQAKQQAERDPLTGLLNRQAAETISCALQDEALRRGRGLVVMLLDLDRFKQINDNYGHDAGDQVLRTVAARLQAAVRDSDVIARLGGDEFLLLLPHTELLDAARRIAIDLIRRVSEPIALEEGPIERIGVSIGIAAFPRHGRDIHLVRKHADAAMYEAKRQGRNGFAIRTDDGEHEVQSFGGIH